MKITDNNKSVILNNCKNNVINIVYKNKTITKNNLTQYSQKFSFSKYSFVILWMTNYKNGLKEIAAAIDRSEWHTWQRYCEFVANGVKLPKPVGHNPYEFDLNKVSHLNRTVENFKELSNDQK